uniref:Uncharacterized protein n=1 Tax=Anguilla anguilla TaxID=7936 RepID=A0A0E9X6K0_ANGAN
MKEIWRTFSLSEQTFRLLLFFLGYYLTGIHTLTYKKNLYWFYCSLWCEFGDTNCGSLCMMNKKNTRKQDSISYKNMFMKYCSLKILCNPILKTAYSIIMCEK